MSKAALVKTDTQAPVQTEAAAIFSMIERVMSDPSVPIERGEQAFAFWQKVQADQAKKAFSSAFVAAQKKLERVRADADNPQTKSKYMSYGALDKALRPIYTEFGFAVTFNTGESPKTEHVRVLCTLMHEGGFEREYAIDMPADGKGAKGGDVMTKTHAAGSALTYGKRYLLGSIFNVATATKDDDGNGAGDGSVISEAQFLELATLIRETGTEMDRFLAIGKLESLSDMPANQFEKAKALLLMKKRGGQK